MRFWMVFHPHVLRKPSVRDYLTRCSGHNLINVWPKGNFISCHHLIANDNHCSSSFDRWFYVFFSTLNFVYNFQFFSLNSKFTPGFSIWNCSALFKGNLSLIKVNAFFSATSFRCLGFLGAVLSVIALDSFKHDQFYFWLIGELFCQFQ